MKEAGAKLLGKAAAQRLFGEQPGPLRAGLAAAVTGTITAGLTYRVLRHGSVTDDDE